MSRSSAAQAAAGLHLAAGASDRVGRVQPHGVLLVVSEPDARIVQASAHAGSWLGHPLESILLGPVDRLGGDLGMRLRQRVDRFEPGTGQALALECTLACATGLRPVEVWVHRVGPDLLALDLLPRTAEGTGTGTGTGVGIAPTGAATLLEHLEDTIHALSQASTIEELAVQAARSLQALCGHEAVHVVRHGHDGLPCVVATSRDGQATAGTHPAQPLLPVDPLGLLEDFPVQAPGGVEVLVDTWAEPVALLPHELPGPAGRAAATAIVTGSTLRAPDPGHQARLRGAGVRAQARAALRREGKSWGLIVCRDGRAARPLSAACRYAFGLVAEAVATRITAIESAGRAEVAAQVRRLQDHLVDATTHAGDWRAALVQEPHLLLEPLQASGAALLYDGDALAFGSVPPAPELQALSAWIDARGAAPVWHSDDLAAEDQVLGGQLAAGTRLLAVRLSVRQPDFLVWFRQPDPTGRAPAPAWSATDLARAASFAEMLVDLMVQADAVRLLVTDRELERLQAKVAHSREAVAVCGRQGEVTLCNEAFAELTGEPATRCRTLDDFLALFTPAAVARRLAGQARAEQRSARSVLGLPRADGSVLPVAVRAEPVLARSGGLLGVIFLVEDLTAARLAEAAWTQLQGLLGSAAADGTGPEVDPVVSALRTHASLAAMDMADTTRTPGLAPLLGEVESSTQRAIDLYRRLRGVLSRAEPR